MDGPKATRHDVELAVVDLGPDQLLLPGIGLELDVDLVHQVGPFNDNISAGPCDKKKSGTDRSSSCRATTSTHLCSQAADSLAKASLRSLCFFSTFAVALCWIERKTVLKSPLVGLGQPFAGALAVDGMAYSALDACESCERPSSS